jgi:hypothetical protein
MVAGRLESMGIHLQRKRIREMTKIVTCRERARQNPIKRRKYKVRAPLSMVHVDGYMKLIRYGIKYGRLCVVQLSCQQC